MYLTLKETEGGANNIQKLGEAVLCSLFRLI